MLTLLLLGCLVVYILIRHGLNYEKLVAFKTIWSMNQHDIEGYFNSYDRLYGEERDFQCNDLTDFDNNVPIMGFKPPDRSVATEDLYKVLHNAILIGDLDKMYIPPKLGKTDDLVENQILAEKKLADFLKVEKGQSLLELGCGSGAIAMSMHKFTQCKITGLNIDQATISKGMAKLKKAANNDVTLKYQDYNAILQLEDNSIDGVYEIQALTFSEDLPGMMRELYRVLKPGKRLAILEGCLLDAFDKRKHLSGKRLWELRGVIAAGALWHYKYFDKAAMDAGFTVVENKSYGGSPGTSGNNSYAPELPILEKTDDNFRILSDHLRVLAYWRLIPPHIPRIFDRVCLGADVLIDMERNHHMTTSRYMVYEKPLIRDKQDD